MVEVSNKRLFKACSVVVEGLFFGLLLSSVSAGFVKIAFYLRSSYLRSRSTSGFHGPSDHIDYFSLGALIVLSTIVCSLGWWAIFGRTAEAGKEWLYFGVAILLIDYSLVFVIEAYLTSFFSESCCYDVINLPIWIPLAFAILTFSCIYGAIRKVFASARLN